MKSSDEEQIKMWKIYADMKKMNLGQLYNLREISELQGKTDFLKVINIVIKHRSEEIVERMIA